MQWAFQAAVFLNYVIALATIGHVLRRRKEPTSMLAWILAILLLPVIGVGCYLLLGESRVRRSARRRRKWVNQVAKLRQSLDARTFVRTPMEVELPADLAPVEAIGKRLADLPGTAGNEVCVYHESSATYAAIEAEIRAATHHIHVEYYIWQPDQTGIFFRDLLIEKARAGVECRVLLDAVGCWKLGNSFLRPMTDAGVRVEFFLPVYRFRKRWSPHLRNHRKIVIVDGATAFMGSQNIGDEYRGRLKRLSPWYDSHMRVRGPAALYLQQIFADDWLFATRESLDLSTYFSAPTVVGDTVVQILPTGPDNDANVLGQVVFSAVSLAKRSIRIATPYFVPDAAMVMALQFAAYRGVRVQLVVPTRTDAPMVLWAGRSYYRDLIGAGVEIFEYPHGVLHNKLVTIDESWCVLSSANMDIRSFRLNFEVTAVLFDAGLTTQINAWIDKRLENSHIITPREVFNRPLHQQLLEGVARLFSPLL